MVRIALNEDVKKSFSKVKDDMLNLKRSLNRELLAIEDIEAKLQKLTSKDEFYNFIKRLGERLDSIEDNVENYNSFVTDIKDLETKTGILTKKLDKREDISSELKEVRKFRAKLSLFESSKVSSKTFNEEMHRVISKIDTINENMLTNVEIKLVDERINSLSAKIESIERNTASKKDVDKNEKEIHSIRKNFDQIQLETKKSNEKIAVSYEINTANLLNSTMNKNQLTDKFNELDKKIRSLRTVVDGSVSEVDFTQYVERDVFEDKLKNLSKEFGLLKKQSTSYDDVDRINSEVRGASKSVEALRNHLEKMESLLRERFDRSLRKTSDEFEERIKNLREDMDRLKNANFERLKKSSVLTRVGKGVSDFFKEEERNEKPLQKSQNTKKKQKKNKKETQRNHLLLIALGFTVLILIYAIFFLFTDNKDGTVDEEADDMQAKYENQSSLDALKRCVEQYECKQGQNGQYWNGCYVDSQNTCRCYITDAAGCKTESENSYSGGNIGYLIIAGIILTIMSVAYFLSFKQNPKNKEKASEDSVDLSEFFEKKK